VEELSDELLMMRYANGDFAAFEVLYLRNKGGLYRYLLRQLKQQSSAEELFQEVWSAVIDSASSYKQSAKFTTWLYRIARNKVIDQHRHLKVVDAVIAQNEETKIEVAAPHDINEDRIANMASESSQYASQNSSPQNEHERAVKAQAIMYCLEKLPKHQLESFLLREESGLSLNDIAQIIDVNLEAAKSRLKTAYKNLRSCLTRRDIRL
jgi:RNA polymerase sigma-70 factor (ECF subfamily)